MAAFPTVWGPGQIFALSGLDGATSCYSPMVGRSLEDRFGFRLLTHPPVELWCQAMLGNAQTCPFPRYEVDFELVSGDAMQLAVRTPTAERGSILLAAAEQDVWLGSTFAGMPVHWAVGPGGRQPLAPGRHRQRISQGLLVVLVEERDGELRFAVSFDPIEESAAVAKASKWMRTGPAAIVRTRQNWYGQQVAPTSLPAELQESYAKALSVMRSHALQAEGRLRGFWTTPSRIGLRHMGLDETAIQAVGWAYAFPEQAMQMLTTALQTQEEDGRLARGMRPDGSQGQFTQSPLIVWAVRRVYELTEDTGFLQEAYPSLGRYLRWYSRHRRYGRTELACWTHPEESRENCPRFDEGCEFAAVDASCLLYRAYLDMQFMAQRLGMEGDEKRWHEMAERLHQAINLDLWNGSAGCYQDRRVPGGFVDASTSSLFWPLFARVSDDERAAGLIEMLRDPRRFRLDAGVPSVAVDDPCYSNDMHRGPVWPAMNAMIAEGLAAYGADELAVDLRQRTLSAIARWYRATGCFWEFYDGQDVRPPASLERKSHRSYGGGQGNIADHHVTAAVFTKLCHEVFG